MTYSQNLLQQYQNDSQKTRKTDIHLYVVIPAYQEQNIIQKTLDYFCKILFSQNISNTTLIVALDGKEKKITKE